MSGSIVLGVSCTTTSLTPGLHHWLRPLAPPRILVSPPSLNGSHFRHVRRDSCQQPPAPGGGTPSAQEKCQESVE
ncbi:hypothetical protein BO78DRAFT_76381 [Aspergillus sclerotiicarbonarius CBS 121057]|uniref:Uncharacterized protein n=1 Tax=Aspergillus sclerotiicarbonarius (strain CBS 121057 / IBT 28362) TaxID=1448318 RepID=A0A319F0C7_ASPSB|nr:hypothetical protein BO78DRAFT_76381 [Aspergillus sclerotiicarbonarius CBS 121057]